MKMEFNPEVETLKAQGTGLTKDPTRKYNKTKWKKTKPYPRKC